MMIVDTRERTDPWETVMAHAYKRLFNTVTDALEHMERENVGLAKDVLIHGQSIAEDLLTGTDDPLELYDPQRHEPIEH